MSVESGEFHLTEEQRRFKSLISAYPTLMQYWDFSAPECLLSDLTSALRVMSPGEKIMAQFFVGIWLGNNTKGFDVFEASGVLNTDDKAVITDWLHAPFWP